MKRSSRHFVRSVFVGTLALATSSLLGCGRLGPPLPPEAFSPQEVENLTATTTSSSVEFRWEAPSSDRRNKELKTIDGYQIKRVELEASQAGGLIELTPVSEEAEPVEVGFVEDLHLRELQRLKKAARSEGRSARKIDVDPALKQFVFSDTDVTPGKRYSYSIVPVNQGGVEGRVRHRIEVHFRGELSQPVVIDTLRQGNILPGGGEVDLSAGEGSPDLVVPDDGTHQAR
jgi:hypothetical protein